MKRNVKIVCDSGNIHGEGPVWRESTQTLLWTDIEAPAICQFQPESGRYLSYPLPDKLCSFGIIDDRTILAAFSATLAIYDIEERKIIRDVPIETEVPGTRMNDGRTDRSGKFVLSGFDPEGKGRSGIYCVGKDLTFSKWFGGVSSGNSICFSPDNRTMYFADTPEAVIWAYDYDHGTGSIGKRTLFFDFSNEPGLPDGSMVDSDGCLWNAEWNGYRVIRISPEGQLDEVVEIPVKNPTCVAFGGKDLKTMYVTTSRLMMSEDEFAAEPQSGGLFSFDLSVSGIADSRYRF